MIESESAEVSVSPDAERRSTWARVTSNSRDPGLRKRYAQICADGLPVLFFGLGVVLVLAVVFRFDSVQGSTGVVVMLASLIMGAFLLLLAIRARRDGTQPRKSHRRAALSLFAVTFLLATNMILLASPIFTAYLSLLVVVAGAVLLDIRWYAATVAVMWVVWLLVAAPLNGAQGWWLVLSAGTVVSAGIHHMRTEFVAKVAGALTAAQEAAVHDSLTGLLNRRGLQLVASEMMALAIRNREAIGCTFIDVDGLKRVNDELGHDEGDRLIVETAEAIAAQFRDADAVARWGGDEFAVITMGRGPSADDVERRIASCLARTFAEDGRASVSAGRVVQLPWQTTDLQLLLEEADQEMYRRRRLRRSQV